tara:strand:+ start:176 stop:427 length:252 start_codon:yes stop_codon:yes gene_type:complete
VAKKNSKKNKFKSKDRFRDSIIKNDSIELNVDEAYDSNKNVSKSNSISVITSNKVHSLGSELKLIGIIGLILLVILTISSFVI